MTAKLSNVLSTFTEPPHTYLCPSGQPWKRYLIFRLARFVRLCQRITRLRRSLVPLLCAHKTVARPRVVLASFPDCDTPKADVKGPVYAGPTLQGPPGQRANCVSRSDIDFLHRLTFSRRAFRRKANVQQRRGGWNVRKRSIASGRALSAFLSNPDDRST